MTPDPLRLIGQHRPSAQVSTKAGELHIAKRGPYVLRHTAITVWLAAGAPIFDVARYAGTSVEMIDRTYGHLARGSEQHMRERLAAYAKQETKSSRG